MQMNGGCLRCGMACCVAFTVVAWQTKDTFLQPTDAKVYVERFREEKYTWRMGRLKQEKDDLRKKQKTMKSHCWEDLSTYLYLRISYSCA